MPPALDPGRRIRLALLAAAAAPLSAWLACATPFPALAALAALDRPRRAALACLGLAWGSNQAIGFGLLGYPQDAATLGWGAAIGAAALAAGLAALLAVRAVRGRLSGPAWEPLHAGLALIAGFVAYEAVLAAAAQVLPSGPGAYAPAVVARLLLVNAACLLGLVLAEWLGRRIGPARARAA